MVTPSLSFTTGIRIIAKYIHRYTTAPRAISAIVKIEFSSPRSMYHARITNPIATALMVEHIIFAVRDSLMMSAATPLKARMTTPIINGGLTLSKVCSVIFATMEHTSRKRNETAETIVIFFISDSLKRFIKSGGRVQYRIATAELFKLFVEKLVDKGSALLVAVEHKTDDHNCCEYEEVVERLDLVSVECREYHK